MTNYQETLARHRRSLILRVLASAPGYAANETLLREVLAGHGLSTARAQIRSDIAWLSERSLVSAERIAGIMIVRWRGCRRGPRTAPRRPTAGALRWLVAAP